MGEDSDVLHVNQALWMLTAPHAMDMRRSLWKRHEYRGWPSLERPATGAPGGTLPLAAGVQRTRPAPPTATCRQSEPGCHSRRQTRPRGAEPASGLASKLGMLEKVELASAAEAP